MENKYNRRHTLVPLRLYPVEQLRQWSQQSASEGAESEICLDRAPHIVLQRRYAANIV